MKHMEYKYTGIILNKREIGETDRIYTIYTLEGGKIRSIAKGVRKPEAKLAASLENITLADVTIVRTRGLGKITGSIIENSFAALKIDCDALLSVFSSMSIFDKLVDFESPDQKVFGLLRDYLEAVDVCARKKAGEKYMLLKLGFVTKLLFELGYAIEASRCINCGGNLRGGFLGFSSQQGGILCGECLQKSDQQTLPIKINAIKMIRLFLHNKMSALEKINASKEDCQNVQMVVDDFLRWQT
jgi:DNA repair protein RecO (recombination protein O)